jgi:hypothetical protein
MMVPREVCTAFGAAGEISVLCAESSTVKVGDIVIKRLEATALENNRYPLQ